ncbi:MAG TPA: hemerythrin domain-containing protein [Chitinophagaceae bacterium]|nr:hemerythrin domain-containing protein [Chitinophagaceae bacterium]
MAPIQKPIKRSPQLAPLSREHHEGLLFGWKLKQGLANGIEERRISSFIEWFWQQHLQPHFTKEEQALPQLLSPAHPMIQQMLHEHDDIKNRVEEAIEHGDLKKFDALAQAVTDHIRFEERQLFAEVEKRASPEQLALLETVIKDEAHNDVWPDAFWIKPA